MVGVWMERLSRHEPQTISAAIDAWIDGHDTWPVPSKFMPLVDAALARQQARVEGTKLTPTEELSRAVNVAFSFLADAHLRELDRLLPPEREAIARALGEAFLPVWREAIMWDWQPRKHEVRRRWTEMATQLVERRLGVDWRGILSKEAEARGPVEPMRAKGFTSVGEALGAAA